MKVQRTVGTAGTTTPSAVPSIAVPLLSVALLAIPMLAEPVAGQSPDFLFAKPRVTLGVRAGWAAPTAGSDLFDFVTDRLTVDRDDFAGFDFQVDLGVRLRDRLDVVLNVGHSQSETRSEFRDWTGEDDLPIEQTTHFHRTPITLGLKGYLKDRGRAVSRFAWVPGGWAPYVTAGVGLVVYEFNQQGEFVDYETLDIFQDTFRSEGVAPAFQAGGGVEVSIGPRLLASGDARYVWAKDDMSRDFVDFDSIDLSGLQMSLGLAVRF